MIHKKLITLFSGKGIGRLRDSRGRKFFIVFYFVHVMFELGIIHSKYVKRLKNGILYEQLTNLLTTVYGIRERENVLWV